MDRNAKMNSKLEKFFLNVWLGLASALNQKLLGHLGQIEPN